MMTQPTTHLLDCNEDVLRLILGYLSQDDLRKVCLVHSQLRHLAEAPLYSRIELLYDQEKYSAWHPITSLIRTILRRPDLASRIRTLSCTRGRTQRGVLNVPVCQEYLREALSFVERTRLVRYRDAWMEELREGTMDAHLAILLSQLPRLQYLRLSDKFYQKSDLIGLVLRSMFCDSHSEWPIPGFRSTSLHQLHTVALEWYPSRHLSSKARNTERALAFFYLPSIKDMSVLIGDPPEESHLGQVLAAAPRLHSLHWHWHFDPDYEDQFNSPTVNLDLLMPALAPLKDTLTTLTISALCLYTRQSYIPFPLRVQGSMLPLADFEQLKTLTIPLVFFTGFPLPVQHTLGDCLPRNLEELTLTDELYADIDTEEPWDKTGHTVAISTWLADVRASTPRLRRLSLVLRGEDDEVCSEELEVRNEIRELARGAGIELVMRRECEGE
ncbi:hypothetical protein B0I37DRAFT_78412 [Chaetomium sp. MPI-CAGE-AT-0009]|nr:hypothetical protein B0I37DRAFT_78412 [Chaetomium sp. MPI-CAGE-AT-0009]